MNRARRLLAGFLYLVVLMTFVSCSSDSSSGGSDVVPSGDSRGKDVVSDLTGVTDPDLWADGVPDQSAGDTPGAEDTPLGEIGTPDTLLPGDTEVNTEVLDTGPEILPDCYIDEECDDGIFCTLDRCIAGACLNTPDSSLCNAGETCNVSKGGCHKAKSCFNDGQCEDFLNCSVEGCNQSTNLCEIIYDDARCPSNTICVPFEWLQSIGADLSAPTENNRYEGCVLTSRCNIDSDCGSQSNACVAPVCVAGFCSFEYLDGSNCSDGNSCNGEETCRYPTQMSTGNLTSCYRHGEDQAATCGLPPWGWTLDWYCATGTPKVCDDGNPCTVGSCRPSDGMCIHEPGPNGVSCQQGLGTCQAGNCSCSFLNCAGTCCQQGQVCSSTQCCTPNCAGKECGNDGCGGSCGTCAAGRQCGQNQICFDPCAGKECGNDGYGGICGECAPGSSCDAGICCTPNCTGRECGPDGCGGTCGTCTGGAVCNVGTCEEEQEMGCSDIFDCLNACPMGNQGCQTNCVNAAPIEAQIAFNNVVQCLQNAGYWDCAYGDQECLTTASNQCEDEIVICFSGDLTCKDMYLCVVNCPNDATGQACVQACLGEGNADAQYLWNDFIGCLQDNGYFDCAEGDSECYGDAWDKCMTEFRACVHGDTSCMDILNCHNACPPTDQICALECQVNGTVAAQEAFELLVDCVVEACGEDSSAECQNQALEGVCGTLHAACQGNGV